MKKNIPEAPKVRQKDKEAELDARIRAIREQEQKRMQRKKEVEEDIEERQRAADSDKARLSVCIRRSPSPEEPDEQIHAASAAAGSASRRFLHDPARETPRGRQQSETETARMTARQRREHERWLQERSNIDQLRLQRARTPDGGWRREWDRQKQPDPQQREGTRSLQKGQQPGAAGDAGGKTRTAAGVGRAVTNPAGGGGPAEDASQHAAGTESRRDPPPAGDRRRRRRGGRRRREPAASRSPPRYTEEDAAADLRDDEEEGPLLQLIRQSSEAPEPHYDELRDLRDYEEDYTPDEPGVLDTARERCSSVSSADGSDVQPGSGQQPARAVSPISALLSSAASTPSNAPTLYHSPMADPGAALPPVYHSPMADPSAVLAVARDLAQMTRPALAGSPPAYGNSTGQPLTGYCEPPAPALGRTAAAQLYCSSPTQGCAVAAAAVGPAHTATHSELGYNGAHLIQAFSASSPVQGFIASSRLKGFSATPPNQGFSASVLPHVYNAPPPVQAFSVSSPVQEFSASPPVQGSSFVSDLRSPEPVAGQSPCSAVTAALPPATAPLSRHTGPESEQVVSPPSVGLPAARYVPPHKRRPEPRAPAPAPAPARSSIQCVTFVDGKMVEGEFDDSVFKIQDIRLKDGTL